MSLAGRICHQSSKPLRSSPSRWNHPLSTPFTSLVGIPDSTEKLAELGLIPFSDALEQVDASEVPGLSAAFGVTSITGGPRPPA